MPSPDEVSLEMKILRKDLDDLEEDFNELRSENRESRKGIHTRLSELEKTVAHVPSPEQQDLINQATNYYKAKRDFWEKLVAELVGKGLIAVAGFICLAVIFYVKNLLGKSL